MPAAGILGWKKEQTLETYSAQLQKPRNFTVLRFRKYKKYLAKEDHEGGNLLSTRVGAHPPSPGAPPCIVPPPEGPPMPIFSYMRCFDLEKNIRRLSGPDAAVSRRKPI